MSKTFYPGQKDYIDKLNHMDEAFAAGPYDALPLTGGTLTGRVTSSAPFWTSDFVAAQKLQIGVPNPTQRTYSVIQNPAQVQGNPNLEISASALFFVASGPIGNASSTAISVGYNNQTGRSISAAGTVNANGADYAEYLIKSLSCGTIAPGQVVGIDADGKLTDQWDRAVTFMTKSTNPCMVGGDGWSRTLGVRPAAPARGLADISDAQWALAVAAHAAAEAAFDAHLEALRQTVDRIAFAGQVPVNVLGAMPGQYIVPQQDGAGIKGVAVGAADITLQQYLRAVGKVIAIEDDGRARIIVKVA